MNFPKNGTWKNDVFSSHRTALQAVVALLVILLAQNLIAQTGRGNIGGTVTDSQGAVVAGAAVTITSTDTGVTTPTTTNGAGLYAVEQLVPGNYSIKVEREGFGSQEKDNITLTAEQSLGMDFSLQPGKVSEKVTVSATGQLVNTETAVLSQTIDEHAITELPLNGRNPATLVLLTPGTVDLGNINSTEGIQTYTTFPTETIASTNGSRQGSTLYLLDGAYNVDNYQLGSAPFPNPDATQEFTVLGNNFDPRYGFAPGGVVSIVTKSGTSQWHGDAFEFFRSGELNAKDYFTGLTNEVHRNQFGGSIGGPILRDKLFIFGNYQGTRQSIFNSQSTGYVWTPAMINNGDFSAYCQSGFTNGLCNDRNPNPSNPGDPLVTDQIWTANPQGYPASGVPLSKVTGQPANTSGVGGLYYPNNQINPGTFSPQAVALGKVLATGLTPLNQYGSITGAGYPTINTFDEFTIRTDYNLTDHHRISFRVYDNFFNQPAYSGGNAVSTNRSWLVNWQSYSGTYTWTINPHMVNNATGSYTRMFDSSNSGLIIGGKRVCFSQFTMLADFVGTPCSIEGLTINGGYGSAGGFPGNWQNFNGINRWTGGFSDNISISKGKHLIVAGVDVLRQYWYENTDWLGLAILGFGGGPNGQFTGNGFSDFLLGDMSSLEQGGGESNIVRSWMIAPYVADQFKLKPNVTLSLGLRYEPWISPVPENGREAVWYPGHQSTRYPNAPEGMLFPGDAGVSGTGTPSDYKRFWDPRIGIAWVPKALPNTSIRAAFGTYATPLSNSSYNHASDTAPFSPTYTYNTTESINGSPIPIIPFGNPWSVYSPVGNTSPFPPFSSPGYNPASTATFLPPTFIQSGFDRNYTDGRTYTWNLSMQTQYGSNWSTTLAYVGSESDHQSYFNDANLGLPICGPVSATCAQVTSNPRVNPNFTQVLNSYSGATANYHAAQVSVNRRFADGLQFMANYTWSHTIDITNTGNDFSGALDDPGCVKCNRGNSYIDTPQVFVANFVYETPTIASWNLIAREAAGGWQISGIYRAQSGPTFTIACGCTESWQDDGQDYPDFATGVHRVHVQHGNLTNYLIASDFVNPPQGSNGDIGRNPPGVSGPGINTWDLGLSKNIRYKERYRFQFRWEMFNALNRPTFASPNQNTSSSSFGLINSTNGNFPARVMQVAGKLYF
jgi:hypothetical protein